MPHTQFAAVLRHLHDLASGDDTDRYLAEIGSAAKQAVPALNELWKDATDPFRDAAAKALKTIDPEAAAKGRHPMSPAARVLFSPLIYLCTLSSLLCDPIWDSRCLSRKSGYAPAAPMSSRCGMHLCQGP
jgi:hypothetical protein